MCKNGTTNSISYIPLQFLLCLFFTKFFLPVTSERDNQTAQNSLCSIINVRPCIASNSRQNLQARSGRFARRSPATLPNIFSNKKSRRAVLASLWKVACFKPTMSSSAWRILFPVFFSSRELSSINDESALLTCVSSMITHDSRR